MHFSQAKILSSQNGMNIYRGCTHGSYTVMPEVRAISLLMILKILKLKLMHLNFWKKHLIQKGKNA